tara:strand:+ start:1406 stop:2584 length:1179 start_codon:yes stop_codon:yes gene_type:complete
MAELNFNDFPTIASYVEEIPQALSSDGTKKETQLKNLKFLEQAIKNEGITNRNLIRSLVRLMYKESTFGLNLISDTGASGILQIIPSDAHDLRHLKMKGSWKYGKEVQALIKERFGDKQPTSKQLKKFFAGKSKQRAALQNDLKNPERALDNITLGVRYYTALFTEDFEGKKTEESNDDIERLANSTGSYNQGYKGYINKNRKPPEGYVEFISGIKDGAIVGEVDDVPVPLETTTEVVPEEPTIPSGVEEQTTPEDFDAFTKAPDIERPEFIETVKKVGNELVDTVSNMLPEMPEPEVEDVVEPEVETAPAPEDITSSNIENMAGMSVHERRTIPNNDASMEDRIDTVKQQFNLEQELQNISEELGEPETDPEKIEFTPEPIENTQSWQKTI